MSAPHNKSGPPRGRSIAATVLPAHSPLLAVTVCLAVALCGAAVMVLELIGTRVLAPIFGNSLYVWTALIAVALVSLTAGYPLGGVIADRWPRPRTFFALIGVAGLLTLGTLLLRGPVLEAAADWGPRGGTLGAALILFTPPLLMLGTVFPFAVRLLAREVAHIGVTVGSLSALSAAGSIAGTITTGWILIPQAGIRNILLGVAAGLILIGIAGLLVSRVPRLAAVGTLVGALAVLLVSWGDAGARTSDAPFDVLFDVAGGYGDVKVVEYPESRVRLMFLGQSMQTADIPGDEYLDVCDLVHWVPLLRPEARRVLLIGLGGGHVVKALNAHGIAVDAVEIDPMVIEGATRFFDIAEGPLCRIIEEDGRPLLNRCEPRYDAVIVNAFAGSEIPPHLSSREAFAAMKRCLVPGGLLMMNSMGLPADPGGGVLGDLMATLRAGDQFGTVRAYGWNVDEQDEGLASYMIVATDGPLDIAAARNERGLPADLLSRLAAAAREVPVAPDRGTVLTDDRNPLDLRQLSVNDIQRRGTLNGPFRELFVPSR